MDKARAYFAQPRKLKVCKSVGGCVCGNLNLLYVSEVWLESNNQWHWQCENFRPVPKQFLVC